MTENKDIAKKGPQPPPSVNIGTPISGFSETSVPLGAIRAMKGMAGMSGMGIMRVRPVAPDWPGVKRGNEYGGYGGYGAPGDKSAPIQAPDASKPSVEFYAPAHVRRPPGRPKRSLHLSQQSHSSAHETVLDFANVTPNSSNMTNLHTPAANAQINTHFSNQAVFSQPTLKSTPTTSQYKENSSNTTPQSEDSSVKLPPSTDDKLLPSKTLPETVPEALPSTTTTSAVKDESLPDDSKANIPINVNEPNQPVSSVNVDSSQDSSVSSLMAQALSYAQETLSSAHSKELDDLTKRHALQADTLAQQHKLQQEPMQKPFTDESRMQLLRDVQKMEHSHQRMQMVKAQEKEIKKMRQRHADEISNEQRVRYLQLKQMLKFHAQERICNNIKKGEEPETPSSPVSPAKNPSGKFSPLKRVSSLKTRRSYRPMPLNLAKIPSFSNSVPTPCLTADTSSAPNSSIPPAELPNPLSGIPPQPLNQQEEPREEHQHQQQAKESGFDHLRYYQTPYPSLNTFPNTYNPFSGPTFPPYALPIPNGMPVPLPIPPILPSYPLVPAMGFPLPGFSAVPQNDIGSEASNRNSQQPLPNFPQQFPGPFPIPPTSLTTPLTPQGSNFNSVDGRTLGFKNGDRKSITTQTMGASTSVFRLPMNESSPDRPRKVQIGDQSGLPQVVRPISPEEKGTNPEKHAANDLPRPTPPPRPRGRKPGTKPKSLRDSSLQKIPRSERYWLDQQSKFMSDLENLGFEVRVTNNFEYECSLCKKCFNSRLLCIRHAAEHLDRKAFWCIECGLEFTRCDTLQRHYKGRCEKRLPKPAKRFSPFRGREWLSQHDSKGENDDENDDVPTSGMRLVGESSTLNPQLSGDSTSSDDMKDNATSDSQVKNKDEESRIPGPVLPQLSV